MAAQPNDLHKLGLREAAKAVAERKVSPLELVEATLARIDAHAHLHAYATVMRDEALATAKTLTQEAARGELRGPLHGVPVAAKDLCDTQGTPTAAGMPLLRQRVPEADATVIRKLKEAGAIVIGKTEMTEGALAFHHPDVVAPISPWGETLWTGSSSSGSGVAVAAELCYGAIGSDTGGSIRFPSYCNGIVGIKPTWGRVSRHGVFPLSWTLDHIGPMTRRVEDAALMLQAIAGRDDADATSIAADVPDYTVRLGAGLKGLRIGFDEAYATAGVIPQIVEAMARAIEIFRQHGATIHNIDMPDTAGANQAWTPICLAEAACVHSSVTKADLDKYGPLLRGFLDAGRAVTGESYAKANLARREFAGNLNAVFQKVDLLVVPVMGSDVPTVQQFAEICPDPAGLEQLVYFTCLYDVSGHPTINLPAGVLKNGSPIGFQLVAAHLGEEVLCRAGHAFQQDFGWDGRPAAR